MFDTNSDLHIELAEELLTCLHAKSKWGTGFWTWVSLSNLKIHYDGKVVQAYHGYFFPEKLCIEFYLQHLVKVGLVEKHTDLFLKDQFYRVSALGRALVDAGEDSVYNYLTDHPVL